LLTIPKEARIDMTYVNSTRAARKSVFDRFSGLNETLATWLRQRRIYARTVAELDGLNDRDLADLGISRLSIPKIAHEAAYGK
jgi:uncharacterized protein YjiS (DUF1127 family)